MLAILIVATSLPCLTHGDAPVIPNHWPLQRQPGPDGDPNQDPATFPKSSVPPQTPQKRTSPQRQPLTDLGAGDWQLSGGWKLQAVIRVPDSVREIAQPGYDASSWYDATVPGTVLTTLVDQGVYPEPTYGLNNLAIPESLARQDYWYRTEFTVPADLAGRTLMLTFNGINYTADVWCNGTRLGEIRGAFQRGTFDLSALVRFGQPNALAIRISPAPHPGIPHEESLIAGAGAPNGGSLCTDGPTFFCTEGWDWIPGIRDRCTGLWQDVVLHVGGPIVFGDTQVKTDLPLPNLSSATIAIAAEVENRSAAKQRFTVRAEFEGCSVEQTVSLAAHERSLVQFSPTDFAELRLKNPRLWWPNGYGAPELYHLTLTVLDSNHHATEVKTLRFGIREITYELSAFDTTGAVNRFDFNPLAAGDRLLIDQRHEAIRPSPTAWLPTLTASTNNTAGLSAVAADSPTAPFLVIKVNGVPIVCKGGNWGLDEALKRSDRARLEPFFRLQRDAHLTMVRNWCGQNTEQVFFDLADEYGLMVWSDFWLSTQDWNQQPADPTLFLANASDVIRRFRNHPSIVLWCGRNEGVPPPILNEGLAALVRTLDGTRYYQPASRDLNLLDSGPWTYGDPVNFFNKHGLGFSTELGLPNIPTADAIRAMMPAADQWPISDTWAYHDWHQAHHGEVQTFMDALARQFGPGASLDDFCRKAQMLNYVGHRALFEGLNARLWQPASGRLMWMSHPAWPSTEWQLYSSDYDTNAAYFGARKACEPLHVQLNLDDHQVVITNTTLTNLAGLTVTAELFDLHGRSLGHQQVALAAPANRTTPVFFLDEKPVAELPLYFVKLVLTASDKHQLSDNFYWLTRRDEDHRLLNDLPPVALTGAARVDVTGRIEVEFTNPSTEPALLIKPTLRDAAGQRVLPAYVSDGGFSLLPGETRHFTIEVPTKPAGDLQITAEGWNLAPLTVPAGRD